MRPAGAQEGCQERPGYGMRFGEALGRQKGTILDSFWSSFWTPFQGLVLGSFLIDCRALQKRIRRVDPGRVGATPLRLPPRVAKATNGYQLQSS
jgi:hypothetical protein